MLAQGHSSWLHLLGQGLLPLLVLVLLVLLMGLVLLVLVLVLVAAVAWVLWWRQQAVTCTASTP